MRLVCAPSQPVWGQPRMERILWTVLSAACWQNQTTLPSPKHIKTQLDSHLKCYRKPIKAALEIKDCLLYIKEKISFTIENNAILFSPKQACIWIFRLNDTIGGGDLSQWSIQISALYTTGLAAGDEKKHNCIGQHADWYIYHTNKCKWLYT